jgi:cation diffusion facilitator CzcD-associated flavoprotein CzcO
MERNRDMRAKSKLVPVALLGLMLISCGGNSPPVVTTPNPPQVTAATAMHSFATILDAAITGLISARDNGKLSQADLTAAEGIVAVLATTGKQIDAELRSADSWDVQKTAIVKLITDSGVRNAAAHLPPSASALLSAAYAAFNQISTAAGGPTI